MPALESLPFHFIVNVNWPGHRPCIVVSISYDIEEQSPELTVVNGKARIIKWTSGLNTQQTCDGGIDFTVTDTWHINLTEWKEGATQVLFNYGGERQPHGPRYSRGPSGGFVDLWNGCGEPEGTVFFTQGSGPRGDGPPGARFYDAALTDPAPGPWWINEEAGVADWNHTIQIYNGHFEVWRIAEASDPNAKPVWPTQDTEQEETYLIPPGFTFFETHVLKLKDMDPHCEINRDPVLDTFEGVIVRKSTIHTLTHSIPRTSNTRDRSGTEWLVRELTKTRGFTYTLEENWKYDDMYAGAYFDDWEHLLEGDAEPSDLNLFKRIDCSAP